jgi:hypothetical protein
VGKYGVTYTVKFEGQSLELGKINDKIAESTAEVGQQGNTIDTSSIGQTATFDKGIETWAEQARDSLMGNASGIIAFTQRLNEAV